jgi:lipoprotein signal peptidase
MTTPTDGEGWVGGISGMHSCELLQLWTSIQQIDVHFSVFGSPTSGGVGNLFDKILVKKKLATQHCVWSEIHFFT